MQVTTRAILSALARIDSGSLTLPLDESIYPEAIVQEFVEQCGHHCTATMQRSAGTLHLQLTATDPSAARIQIGNALTDLLQGSLLARG